MDSYSEMMQQPVSRMITVKGQRLHVTIRPGNGTQTPLLLMNGLGARLEVFQSFIDELDPALEVISFDVPGIGDSPAPIIPYHLTSLACLVASMLDKLGYKQVDVLGLSWGGWLAQQFAFQYRRRCRRLILACTGPGTLMVPGDPKALARLLTLQYFIDPYYIEKTAPELFGGHPQANPQRLRRFAHAMQASKPSGYLYQLLAGVGWTSLPWLWLLRQPTLILAGDDDRLVPLANARIFQYLIPRSELHIYQGGHLDIVTHQKGITPVIEQFLSRNVA